MTSIFGQALKTRLPLQGIVIFCIMAALRKASCEAFKEPSLKNLEVQTFHGIVPLRQRRTRENSEKPDV
jgi:hypothetical protein